jgi:hypothetical protein
MEQLRNFTMAELHTKLSLNDIEFDAWLVEIGLLHGKRTCVCGGKTSPHIIDNKTYGNWRCTSYKCRKATGFLCGTFFEGTRLTTKQIFQLSYWWCHRIGTFDEHVFQSKMDRHTVADWLNFFRDICAEFFIREDVVIGGEGKFKI